MMSTENLRLIDFYKDETLLEKKKKKKKKSRKSSKKPDGIRKGSGGLDAGWYDAGAPGGSSGTGGGGGAVGESLISEIFAGITPSAFSANINATSQFSVGYEKPEKDPGMTTYPSEGPEEEVEMKANKVDQARQLFQSMYNQPNATRAEIINSFMKDVGVTNSTAVSYYTRFLDEFGLNTKDGDEALGQGTGMGGGMGDVAAAGDGQETPPVDTEEPVEMEDPIDPNRAGIIRTIDNAHLIYKRQSEDGTYDELWIYNIHSGTNDEMDIRRDILAGTDIPQKKTMSADAKQKYIVTTMGNAQMVKITGLPN